MPFEVKDNKSGKLYIVYSINFYAMGAVNPDVKFLLWDVADQCWRVDYAANYIPTKHAVWSLKEKEESFEDDELDYELFLASMEDETDEVDDCNDDPHSNYQPYKGDPYIGMFLDAVDDALTPEIPKEER